jgi:integrase
MPWRDIPPFMATEIAGKPVTVGRQMLELLILTASRSGEIRGMRWEELGLDEAIWTIPAARMKAKVAHRVPLSLRCVELLTTIKGEAKRTGLVFKTRNGTPLSDMAPHQAPPRCQGKERHARPRGHRTRVPLVLSGLGLGKRLSTRRGRARTRSHHQQFYRSRVPPD